MTKRRCFLSMLLIFVLTLSAMLGVFATHKNAYASAEIFADVKNSSFESVDSETFGKDLPTDWVIDSQNLDINKVNVVSINAYDRINYLQVEGDTYLVESQDYIQIENDYDYLFGVKMLFASAEDSVTLIVKTYSEDNELIGTYQSQTIVSTADFIGTWQENFFVLNKNASAKKIKISIEINAINGKVGVDNVYAYKNFIGLYDGASISLERNVLAIRFTAKVDVNIYQTLLNNYEEVTAGIIVSPKSQVLKSGEFTMLGVTEKDKIIVSPATHWNNPLSFEQDGYYDYFSAFASQGYASLEGYINIAFTTRAYIKYVENGVEKVIYSSWNYENNCRTIKQVATSAKQDAQTYNSYSPDQQEIITAYIEGRVPNFEGLD